jgi:hypothetical protein
MGSTLLALVQAATTELGLPTPQYVVRSADNTGRQFGGLANRVGQMIVRAKDWSFLTGRFYITVPNPITADGTLTAGATIITALPGATVATLLPGKMVVSGAGLMNDTRLVAIDQTNGQVTISVPATASATAETLTFSQDTFPTPPDYMRAINRTQWDRSMRWELRGPQSPQWDQWVRSGIVATGPRRMFREINNAYRIWPVPSSTDSGAELIGEYISNYWVTSASGAGQSAFLADGDTCAFDDDLMVMGLKMLFFQTKGFAYDDLKEDWYRSLTTAMATDGGSQTLDMTRTNFPIFISPANIPDTGFGNP